jgi:hypothetical protein
MAVTHFLARLKSVHQFRISRVIQLDQYPRLIKNQAKPSPKKALFAALQNI